MDHAEISQKLRAQAEDFGLHERMRQQAEDLNKGAPIPTVRPSDIEQLWYAMPHIKADNPPRPNVAMGMGVVASYGVEAAADRPEEFFSVSHRHQLLSYLVGKGVLNDYKHGEELDERVFRAAATVPCDIQDLGETILPLLFAKSPPDEVAKAKKDMLAHGYDPDKPNLEGKFLNWLRDNC